MSVHGVFVKHLHYKWSETNPYKYSFLSPADEVLESIIDAEVRTYAENEWEQNGYSAITFITELGNDLTGEQRFFAVLCCPATTTAQGQNSYHAAEAYNEDDAEGLCDYMADMMRQGSGLTQFAENESTPHIPASEAHLWN